ncbi:MAG TPA: lysylphosphatidylglycerol synthase transmembrane domain-containing protein [bacterium]|nr:lysylphosphatidylglycerol synthase transmembrane domain-containing protein [bacterium]HOL34771.1 lysylphosphatidylglycerol synthase transmembrane domain-containing protein [bacterium]HPP07770.1 lysylphosphatidylglycerol synthase transmembrane domain-containing protein [bacterium]
MKRLVSIFIKVFVSGFFIFLITKKIDIPQMIEILQNVDVPFFIVIILINYVVTFFMALRWYFILDEFRKKMPFAKVWQLSLIGMYFNIILPTGAGGDAVKIFYITRNQEEKLKLGTSVIFDRFIGSSSIIFMAILSLLYYQGHLPQKLKITLVFLFILALSVWLLIVWDKLAILTGKLFPRRIREKLRAFYNHLRDYGINRRVFTNAFLASMAVQVISIYVQYLCVILISHADKAFVPFPLFFIFIPIIWLSAMIPSLGGLGIREYGYLFFFKPFIGQEAAIAMALINLFLIFSQAFLGGLIFLFLRQGLRDRK